MQTTQEMAREKQINFRVSEEEAARFDRVASHYGIALAAMLRMLVKEKDDALTHAARLEKERTDEPDEDMHAVLYAFSGWEVGDRLDEENIAYFYYQQGKRPGFADARKALVKADYLKRRAPSARAHSSQFSYELTDKGKAYCLAHWKPAPPSPSPKTKAGK